MPDNSNSTVTEEKDSTKTPEHGDHLDHAKNAIKEAVEKVVDKLPGHDHDHDHAAE